ncbi:MAG: TatD family hydrolase [Chloroflexi bacterium]|nr:TatD family hydrolase [Chloroflexota bacterium]
MELFDSHAHLESERFAGDREEVIARAAQAGVTRILTCGSDLETSTQALALAQGHAGVHAAVGIHGHRASSVAQAHEEHGTDAIAQLADLAQQPGVVALGELGLDYHYDLSPRQAQRLVLGHQLLLAYDLDLPVVLHNRESDDDLRMIVDMAPPVRGVLHCFLADAAMARWALDRGLFLGVAGPITFSNVKHLKPILRDAPLDRLLIETDCPYLAPQPVRGQRNEPAWVTHVAVSLAEALGLPVDELARRTTENACRLFGVS